MKPTLTAACTAAFVLVCPTLAHAITIGGSSVTHTTSFSFTNDALFNYWEPATFTLPKANPGRKLVSAQFSMSSRTTAYLSMGYDDFFPQCPSGSEDEYQFEFDGYCFFSGFEDIMSSIDIYVDISGLAPKYEEYYLYMFYDQYYMFAEGPLYSCYYPYLESQENADSPPFDLGECVRSYWDYGVDTEQSYTHGPVDLESLSALAGPGHYIFEVTATDYWGSLQPALHLTGNASITYTYAPIPLPAALPMLLGALGALGLAARRRGG